VVVLLQVTLQPPGFLAKVRDGLAQIKPATRAYLFATLFCTVVHLTGLPAPALFSLDISKWYELWRPITAVSYLGGLSMSMANSLYFLLRYGQTLEAANGMLTVPSESHYRIVLAANVVLLP
jgi:hypothetical protein